MLTDSTTHTMGVCSIQTNPHSQFHLATGSYDEKVRFWDTRAISRPIACYNTQGGVWRVKWEPAPSDKYGTRILCACMHSGFQVIRLTSSNQLDKHSLPKDTGENKTIGQVNQILDQGSGVSVELVSKYDGHSSLAYGCDWYNGPTDIERPSGLVGSVSFYDHCLALWRISH